MNEQFELSLVQDLRKSGFYSEMMAIHACMAAKWACHGSFTYFDKDERATRECDFEAVRKWDALANLLVTARLLGQVKKSEKPWIVFVDRQVDAFRFEDGLDNIIHTNTTNRTPIGDVLQRHSVVERNGWIGTGIHEAFKKPNDTSRWYAAFVSACKAAESAYDASVATARGKLYFEVIKPLVVLDGVLIAAELSTDGKPLLSETDAAAFSFEYRSDAYERPRYHLDVVTLEGWPRPLNPSLFTDKSTAGGSAWRSRGSLFPSFSAFRTSRSPSRERSGATSHS